ncbi:MAG: sugar phosphate isomerase/epimerase family protein [Isosphaeraceae bacterium]
MHLGIMAKTFPRPTFEETLDAIAERGLTHVQFNMSCTGLPTLPERTDENHCVWIARSFRERGLTMAAISGTFNLCDPDPARLAENLRRLDLLAAACRWLDTRIITLCTGTRDPDDMWKWHPDNVRRSAWDSLVASMREAIQIADRHEVVLVFEPERHNVVNSVARARMLLDTIGSPWLKVVLDPANLLREGELERRDEMLDEAFDWLGPEIVLVHAKPPETGYSPEETMSQVECRKRDPASPLITRDTLEDLRKTKVSRRVSCHLFEVERFFRPFVKRLATIGYSGAVVMHGMAESEVGPMQEVLVGQINRFRWES